MVHAFAQHFIAQRHEHFYALVQIAGHPVGAAKINFFLPAVREIEDPGVLQKAPDDAAHANIVAHAAHAGPQSTNAAHDQIDLDSRLGRTVEGLDHGLIDQRIHLGNDAGRPAFASMIRFTID